MTGVLVGQLRPLPWQSDGVGLGAEHEAMRLVVLDRDGWTCVHCGNPANTADHHPIPRAEGGPTTLDNLVAACGRCNSSHGGQLGAERKAQLERDRQAHPFFCAGGARTPAASWFSPHPLQGP